MSDKLPPHASEAEQALIGCCLEKPVECIPQIQAALAPEAFYALPNRVIWETLLECEASAVNLITIQQWLKDAGRLDQIGGIAYLSACQDICTSTANLDCWIEDVRAKHTRRKIIASCTHAVRVAYESKDSEAALLDAIESVILKIRPSQKNSSDIRSLLAEATAKIEAKFNNPDTLGGLSTGLMDLDRISDGLHPGEMVIVGGFPSTGKTALSVNIAVHCALNQIPAAIFSAEMRPVQLVVRSLCSNARANYHRLKDDTGALSRMVNEAGRLAKSPLYIEAAQGMSIGQVVATARRLKQKHGIKIAVVDYIQLLTGTGDNREQQISSSSKGIKAMALELDIPILALSQLTDDGKLRESRAIGQDADTIWQLENDGAWQPLIQPIKLEIKKCRDGETGKVDLTFFKQFTRFENRSMTE